MNIPPFSPLREHARRHINSLIGLRCDAASSTDGDHAALLVAALAIFIEQAQTMDILCDPHSLFAKHFRETLTQATLTADDLLPVLEDLLILIREKNLRAPALHPCQTERRLLNEVEEGNTWSPADNTAFAKHYFYNLPLHIAKSIMDKIPPLY
ncbi:hypothetical protein LN040_16235 [Desulfovibrio subterraneus]|jgi:hypothetical protein|uniref:hypothetical protein n=1 Tax=Desulfovibrio subterraneus TaxID=2718620 RepID=UPI0022B8707B|nr:hypothetical protein [Desulfovibrio subterraneus]WBF67243.1 hypothetical protein LN040_16235 [Desulfovibrio subterraneus]